VREGGGYKGGCSIGGGLGEMFVFGKKHFL